MSLENNLRLGMLAVEEVKSLGIKASNKVGDRIDAAGGVDNVIAGGGFDRTASNGVTATRHAGIRNYTLGNLRGTSEYTRRTKFGNCWEQAIVALIFLHDRGLKPLDLVAFSAASYDHVWLVIGLDRHCEMTNMRSWGKDAVWCDPWQAEGMCFSIDSFIKGEVRNTFAHFKCDTVARIEAGVPTSHFRVD